jgi:hypothetical protein
MAADCFCGCRASSNCSSDHARLVLLRVSVVVVVVVVVERSPKC